MTRPSLLSPAGLERLAAELADVPAISAEEFEREMRQPQEPRRYDWETFPVQPRELARCAQGHVVRLDSIGGDCPHACLSEACRACPGRPF